MVTLRKQGLSTIDHGVRHPYGSKCPTCHRGYFEAGLIRPRGEWGVVECHGCASGFVPREANLEDLLFVGDVVSVDGLVELVYFAALIHERELWIAALEAFGLRWQDGERREAADEGLEAILWRWGSSFGNFERAFEESGGVRDFERESGWGYKLTNDAVDGVVRAGMLAEGLRRADRLLTWPNCTHTEAVADGAVIPALVRGFHGGRASTHGFVELDLDKVHLYAPRPGAFRSSVILPTTAVYGHIEVGQAQMQYLGGVSWSSPNRLGESWWNSIPSVGDRILIQRQGKSWCRVHDAGHPSRLAGGQGGVEPRHFADTDARRTLAIYGLVEDDLELQAWEEAFDKRFLADEVDTVVLDDCGEVGLTDDQGCAVDKHGNYLDDDCEELSPADAKWFDELDLLD